MLPIRANCREQLTADDFQFIARVLAKDPKQIDSIYNLLTDEMARDTALERKELFDALCDQIDPTCVSPDLYFYVLTRTTLSKFDRPVADYIAKVLTTFLDTNTLSCLPNHPEAGAEYVTDMLTVLREANPDEAFQLRAHMGNYTLFITGIFPDRIQYRESRRGAPNISFYEEVGSTNYRLASDHQFAHEHALTEVYRTISTHFTEVRRGLNRITDQFLHLE